MTNIADCHFSDDEKKIVTARLFDATPKHQTAIAFYFPDDLNLEAIDTYGDVPHKGQRIFINVYGQPEKDRNYIGKSENRVRFWIVTDVYYSITAVESYRASLLRDPTYHAEVKLKPIFFRRGILSKMDTIALSGG